MTTKKGESLSKSTGSCGSALSSIFCCNCRANHDVSDTEESCNHSTGGPNVSVADRDHAAKIKRPVLPSKEGEEMTRNSHVTFSSEAFEVQRSKLAKSDTFSNYIHRAKRMIRTMSNVGTSSEAATDVHLHGTKKDDESKDTFAEYITRAKMKIRRTSSVGSRKDHSL